MYGSITQPEWYWNVIFGVLAYGLHTVTVNSLIVNDIQTSLAQRYCLVACMKSCICTRSRSATISLYYHYIATGPYTSRNSIWFTLNVKYITWHGVRILYDQIHAIQACPRSQIDTFKGHLYEVILTNFNFPLFVFNAAVCGVGWDGSCCRREGCWRYRRGCRCIRRQGRQCIRRRIRRRSALRWPQRCLQSKLIAKRSLVTF